MGAAAAGLPLALAGPAHAQSWTVSPGALPGMRILDLNWTDDSRLRPVPCRLYLPRQDEQSRQPVPLVCFSHGMAGASSTYRYLGHHLATQGVASLHLQPHAGVAPVAAPSLRTGLPDRQLQQARQAEAVALALDARHVLARVFNGPFGELFDPQACVAAGHAWGALTPLLLAGAQALPERSMQRLHDPRIRAAVLLSAPVMDGARPIEETLAPVRIPTLHITAVRDVTRMPGRSIALEDRLAVYRHVGSGTKVLTVFEGGSGAAFTDRSMSAGPDVNRLIKEATQDLVSAFIADVAGGGPEDLWHWQRRYGDRVHRFERQG